MAALSRENKIKSAVGLLEEKLRDIRMTTADIPVLQEELNSVTALCRARAARFTPVRTLNAELAARIPYDRRSANVQKLWFPITHAYKVIASRVREGHRVQIKLRHGVLITAVFRDERPFELQTFAWGQWAVSRAELYPDIDETQAMVFATMCDMGVQDVCFFLHALVDAMRTLVGASPNNTAL